MSATDIFTRKETLLAKLAKQEGKVEVTRAKLKALHKECSHASMTTWQSNDGSWNTECLTCGKRAG